MKIEKSYSLITTYQYRIKDSQKKKKKKLWEKAGLVNFVWNYCNDVQKQAVQKNRKWLNHIDLKNLTSGTSEHIPLHSQTIQAICEEYHTRRQQAHQPYLNFRTHKKIKIYLESERSKGFECK